MSPSNQFVFPIYLGKDEHRPTSKYKRNFRRNSFRIGLTCLMLLLTGGVSFVLYRNPWIFTSINWQGVLLTFISLFVASIITGLAIFRFIRLRELMAAPAPIEVKARPINKLVAQKKVKSPVEYKSVTIDAEMWTKDRNKSTENGRYQIGYLPEEFSADDVLVFSFEYGE